MKSVLAHGNYRSNRGIPIHDSPLDHDKAYNKFPQSASLRQGLSETLIQQFYCPCPLLFQNVIAWVRKNFTNYRKEMASVNWGELYNQFKDKKLSAEKLEVEIALLMQDEDVTKKFGIYPYVLTRQERHLSIRAFNDKMKRESYERQKGICVARNALCKNAHFDINEMEADHITPWHEGGKTTAENCQMLCKQDNRTKSGD